MKKKTAWITIAVAAVILCCCLVLILGGVGYYLNQTGDFALFPTATFTRRPPTATPVPSPTFTPTAVPLGSTQRPLVFSLRPNAGGDELSATNEFILRLSLETGYTILLVTPGSNAEWMAGLRSGEIHMTLMSAVESVVALEQGAGDPGMAAVRDGFTMYQAQVIANVDKGFTPYFDLDSMDDALWRSTADAATALSQFEGRTPCWVADLSPSGRLLVSGYLADAGIQTAPEVILRTGHASVAQTIYNGEQGCDFTSTFIDVRTVLESQNGLPDVYEQVATIWVTDRIIPYTVLMFSSQVPPEVRARLVDSLQSLDADVISSDTLTSLGLWEGLVPVDDEFYGNFLLFAYYLDATGLPLADMLDQ
jgi:phosphonate transport system substrate-binding protein